MRMNGVLVGLALGLAVVVSGGCGGGFRGCLVEGTMIATPVGDRPVESLRVGDAIWTRGEDGRPVAGEVTVISSFDVASYLRLHLADGRTLGVTGKHPIATGDGWKHARKIVRGAALRTEHDSVQVADVRRVRDRVRAYDLTASPNPSFMAEGVWVHNKTIAQPPSLRGLHGVWIGVRRGDVIRLDIREDGSGMMEFVSAHRRTVRQFEPLIIEGYEFRFTAFDLKGHLTPLEVSGMGGWGAISLMFTWSSGGEPRVTDFALIEVVRAALDGAEAHHASEP
jgi:hypothetical protein